MLNERVPDLRRHPRVSVSWAVTVEAGDKRFHLHTLNLSPFGAKVGLAEERLEPGTPAHLRLHPPVGRPVDGLDARDALRGRDRLGLVVVGAALQS